MIRLHQALFIAALAAALASPAALADDIRPVQAQSTQPVKAQSIQPVQAQSIQPVQAQSVEAQPIQAAHSMPAQLVKPSYDTESGRTPTNEAAAQSASTQGFIGSWDMRIPGAAYTTPGTPGSGYDTLHTSVGASARGLIIRANHTYTWESRDGRWRSSGDAEYPLLLIHGLDGHDWKVGTGAGVPGLTERDIIVWDGYSYYYGKRAAGEPAE